MGKLVAEYELTDEDGDKSRVIITDDICLCSGGGASCYDSTLEVFEYGDDMPMRTEIPHSISMHLAGILDGSTKTKVVNHEEGGQ